MVTGNRRTEDNEHEDEYDQYDYIDYFMGGNPKMKGLRDDLLDYESLLQFMEINIQSEEDKIKEDIANFSTENYYQEEDYYNNSVLSYKRLMYQSIFLAVHATFEGRLKQLYELTENHRKNSLKPLRLVKKNIIGNCIKYLINRTALERKDFYKNHKFRESWQTLRNCLVHNNLIFNRIKERDNYRKLTENEFIKLSPISYLGTTEEYFSISVKYSKLLNEYIKIIKELFETFAKALKTWK